MTRCKTGAELFKGDDGWNWDTDTNDWDAPYGVEDNWENARDQLIAEQTKWLEANG